MGEEKKRPIINQYVWGIYLGRVDVVATTWLRDSHGLFDYEATHVVRKAIKTITPCMLTRVGNDVNMTMERDIPARGGLETASNLMMLHIPSKCLLYSVKRMAIVPLLVVPKLRNTKMARISSGLWLKTIYKMTAQLYSHIDIAEL